MSLPIFLFTEFVLSHGILINTKEINNNNKKQKEVNSQSL